MTGSTDPRDEEGTGMAEGSGAVATEEDLESPVTHLDPEEVRRRSSRIRRLQDAAALVAGVLALAAFVAPVFVFEGGTERDASTAGEAAPTDAAPTTGAEPAPEPAEWRTTIPGGFPLALALPPRPDGSLPVADQAGPGAGLARLEICGVGGFRDGAVDRLGVRADRPGGTEGRELLVFADADAAQALLERVEDAALRCPGWTTPARELGDAAVDLVPPGPRASLLQLVRVGNAVLATGRSGGWEPGWARLVLDQMAVVSDRLADEMCLFAADPCEDAAG